MILVFIMTNRGQYLKISQKPCRKEMPLKWWKHRADMFNVPKLWYGRTSHCQLLPSRAVELISTIKWIVFLFSMKVKGTNGIEMQTTMIEYTSQNDAIWNSQRAEKHKTVITNWHHLALDSVGKEQMFQFRKMAALQTGIQWKTNTNFF